MLIWSARLSARLHTGAIEPSPTPSDTDRPPGSRPDSSADEATDAGDQYPALVAGLAARRATWQASAGLGAAGRPLLHQIGLASWSLLGVIALTSVVVLALAAVSSVVLPLLFAAVLAVLFRPLAGRLERRGVPAAAAAGIVVAGLVLVCAAVVGLTVKGIVDQSDRLTDEF